MWLVQVPWLLSAADREALQRELLGAMRERMLRELAEARALLAPVHGWFTEGFDTADLKDAKLPLDRLA
jgi:hypothetical protein